MTSKISALLHAKGIMRSKKKQAIYMRLAAFFLFLMLIVACMRDTGTMENPSSPDADDEWRICVIGESGVEAYSFTEKELITALEEEGALPPGIPARFAHAYSAINNWPVLRYYAAEGYSVAAVLVLAGLYETAQTVTFRGADGYEVSLTREQLLSPRYFYPHANDNEDGAEPVFPLIAWRWREGTDDLAAIREDKPSLVIGQSNPFEHTNPAYVVGVKEILVSEAPYGQWLPATTFPLPGPIPAGETVKLQHPDYGLVKIHYTLDGIEPDTLSPMYNPSTYQPELNAPIPIWENTEIKAIVYGYGKADSEVASFTFTITE
jgi:hypothetical protein